MKDRAASTYHTTAEQAAQFAKNADVKKLILGHFSARYDDLDIILKEAQAIYPKAELALEGTKFEIDGK